jgi:hypothetical protein
MNGAISNVFASYPEPARTRLLSLRTLILNVAAQTKGVGCNYLIDAFTRSKALEPGQSCAAFKVLSGT